MKAVYEMPKVSFEAFMANNAVSACNGVNSLKFTCVEEKVNGEEHQSHTQTFNNVVSWSLVENGCTQNVGFADYVSDGKGEDSWDLRTSDNVSTSFVDDVEAIETGAMQNQQGFMGWLYFVTGQSKKPTWTIEEYGKDEIKGHRLDYDDEKGILHAWLAPLFYCFGNGTYASN